MRRGRGIPSGIIAPPPRLCNMSHMPQTLLVRLRYGGENSNIGDDDDCSVCDPFAHAPIKELTREMYDGPQKYTSSQQFSLILKDCTKSHLSLSSSFVGLNLNFGESVIPL